MKENKSKATVTAVTKDGKPEKGGVKVWQKALHPLRSIVNDLQNHIEDGVKDSVIVSRLQALAKAERAKVEKTETIPARLNRRYEKYTKFAVKRAK